MPLLVKRGVGDSIVIGDNITVRVVAIFGSDRKVMLEVDGPADQRVYRAEKAPNPPAKRRYMVYDDIGNEAEVDGYNPIDAMMNFTKNWPFSIKEIK